MKINDCLSAQQIGQAGAKANDQRKDADFAKTLSDVTGQEKTGSMASAARIATSMMPVSPVGSMLAVNATKAAPSAQVDQALSALDKYSEAMADPSLNLKQISPLVQDLEKEVEKLTRLSQELPKEHRLKDLVDQTAVLASVEAAKFNRGDFN